MTCEHGGDPPLPAKDWSVIRSAEVEADSCPVAESVSPTPAEFRKLDGAEVADYHGDTDAEVSPLLSEDILHDVAQGRFQAVQPPPGGARHVVVCDGCGAREFEGVQYSKVTGLGSGDDFELCQRCYQQACAQVGVPPPASGGDQPDDADDDDRDDNGAAILRDGASVAPKLKFPPR